MPGYGVHSDVEGLLPWSFAALRLSASHDYWLATTWSDGRPHVMPVWGAWIDEAMWFSTDQASRKARNIARDPRCVITTDDPAEPVVVEGVAAFVRDRSEISRFVDGLRAKYASEWVDDLYTVDFFDGALGGGATYRIEPHSVFALRTLEFEASPTRWTF